MMSAAADAPRDPSAVVLAIGVLTHAANSGRREAIRSSWWRCCTAPPAGAGRVIRRFVLRDVDAQQPAVAAEATEHGDLELLHGVGEGRVTVAHRPCVIGGEPLVELRGEARQALRRRRAHRREDAREAGDVARMQRLGRQDDPSEAAGRTRPGAAPRQRTGRARAGTYFAFVCCSCCCLCLLLLIVTGVFVVCFVVANSKKGNAHRPWGTHPPSPWPAAAASMLHCRAAP